MKFIELNKKLKEQILPLYNIVGEDIFLVRQAITILKNHLVKDFDEFNFIILDADKIKSSELEAQIVTLPIGSDYRLVVLNSPSADVVKFLNSYNFEASSVVVACVNASNLKSAEIIDCEKLDRADIQKYVMNYLYKLNTSIEERALDFLIDATNGDMQKIVNELGKLSAYAIEDKVITLNTVTNLVSESQEYVIYMLTNAIDNKDLTAYQKMITNMSKSQSVQEIYSYMGRYFRRMMYIAINKNDDELSKILSIKPYAIKVARQNVKKNGVKFYVNLYNKYVDLDYKIKSGEISPKNALFELVF
ncbi:MAG TPA: DNA polymerase III subunit delta [Candidatus Onthoplasma faecipullorum]|nr:DNA polymerase III subunit delta [Candidatus Onthoplasma faecipullorum]